jgi:hypothetical protein
MKQLIKHTDPNGNPAGYSGSDYINAKVLAAATAETFTVPEGASWVLVTPAAPVFVRWGGSASIPAGDVVNGLAPELITEPTLRRVNAGDTVGVVSSAAQTVTLAFYA